MGGGRKVALISGGIDSVLMCKNYEFDNLVYLYTHSGYNDEEIASIRKNGFKFDVIDFPELKTTSSGYCEMRNLIMACFIVNQYGADQVWMAGLRDDVVADKNEDIFKKYSEVLSQSTNRNIEVISPFYHLSKGELVYENLKHLETIKNTFSCYTPKNKKECGECGACFRKWVALESNGISHYFSSEKTIEKYLKNLHKYDSDRISRILITLKKRDKVIAIDIDGVLANTTDQDYKHSLPIKENIHKINKMQGYKILYTARLEIDRHDTEAWLKKNKVDYNALIMEKIPYDLFIDDLSKNTV